MIRIITKQQFYMFNSIINSLKLSETDKTIMETFHQFIDDYEDEEITVQGYFDDDELIGLIRFSEEDNDYLFEDAVNFASHSITLIGVLLVHPNYRRKGIGRELAKFAISEATTEVIVADPINIEACNFFSSIGFSHENDFEDTDEWLLYKRKIISHTV